MKRMTMGYTSTSGTAHHGAHDFTKFCENPVFKFRDGHLQNMNQVQPENELTVLLFMKMETFFSHNPASRRTR